MALKLRFITLKTSSKPLILHRQNRTWQKIRAVKLLPSVTARILAGKYVSYGLAIFTDISETTVLRLKDFLWLFAGLIVVSWFRMYMLQGYQAGFVTSKEREWSRAAI